MAAPNNNERALHTRDSCRRESSAALYPMDCVLSVRAFQCLKPDVAGGGGAGGSRKNVFLLRFVRSLDI